MSFLQQGCMSAAERLIEMVKACLRRFFDSTLGIAAGGDSLYWSLAESCGQDINAIPFHPASVPLTQVRFAGARYL